MSLLEHVRYFHTLVKQESTVKLVASTDGTSFYLNNTDGSVIGYISEATLGTDTIGVAVPVVNGDDSAKGIAVPNDDSLVIFDAVSFGYGVVAGLILILAFFLIKLGCQKLAKPKVDYSRLRP